MRASISLAVGFSIAVLATMLLYGCSAPVTMYHPQYGSIKCPFAFGYFLYEVQRDCVFDYSIQGFVRVP